MENKGNIINSTLCKGNGNLTCGICTCNDGFYGKQCECKGSEYGENLIDYCKTDDQGEVCSGRGICKCGVCECKTRLNLQEQFSGTYCECDNFSCKRSGGLICAGRGNCECGTCHCIPGWIGETCNCRDDNNTCIPSDESNIVCNGKGDCICGICHCHDVENIRYYGQFCEHYTTYPEQNCDDLKGCVECLAFNTEKLWKNNQCSKCQSNIDMVETDNEKYINKWNNNEHQTVCQMSIESGCTILFKYDVIEGSPKYKDKRFRVEVRKQTNCQKSANILGIALGVVISTVMIGFLVLLVWKLITVMHDRREFAKFEQERNLVRWERGDNPFYKQATTTFNNPTFEQN